MQKLMALVVSAFALVASAPGRADAGELILDIVAQPEVGWLAHPLSGAQLPSPETGTLAFLPRVGAMARFGLTNELAAGIGLEGAGMAQLWARSVTISGKTGDLLAGGYLELAAPLSVGYRIDSGGDFSGLIELQAGPMLALWTNQVLADPSVPDANGLPSKLAVDVPDVVNFGAIARLQAGLEARFFDWFLIAIEPSIGVSWAGTFGLHAGLVLRPSIAFAPML